ncbi:hypothetical protein AB0H83_41535 [Dactylosporangium sp. NPDC050688]|uniref:hypothetical protein n=1 Tax=Dactylosporangium sp. NPDC050688 TaxID=3157217 RepID=UPI0033D9EDE5
MTLHAETPVKTPGSPRPETAALHKDTHTDLLRHPSTAGRDRMPVDAIIVPAAREVTALHAVFAVANVLHTVLVVICSHAARAADAVAEAKQFGVEIIAIDNPSRSLLPRFRTTQALAGTRFEPSATRSDAIPDTSAKRNIGLLLARMAGWERIVFVDDDIAIDAEAVREAVCLLGDEWHAVGLGNHGYPDNSVVCHAYRRAGGKQGAFIGAGALAVAVSKMQAFFPDVYNEDWLFLYEAVAERRVAVVGEMAQHTYDPFADRRRAMQEEFGDCLGEGLFWLLHDQEGDSRDAADHAFWSDFLARRRRFIAEIHRYLSTRDADPKTAKMLVSLDAAAACHKMINPRRMVNFIADWKSDRETWQQFVTDTVNGQEWAIDKALAELGLEYERTPPAVAPDPAPATIPAVAGRGGWFRSWFTRKAQHPSAPVAT